MGKKNVVLDAQECYEELEYIINELECLLEDIEDTCNKEELQQAIDGFKQDLEYLEPKVQEQNEKEQKERNREYENSQGVY